jgi:phosphocarrier protein HPr
MVEKALIIKNKTGLHARPAAQFVDVARKYKSEIVVKKDGKAINPRSIIALLSLCCVQGSKITISITGEDEQEAMEGFTKFLDKLEG